MVMLKSGWVIVGGMPSTDGTTKTPGPPPGSGDLYGIVMQPDGKGFYDVEEYVNTLVQAR